MSAWADGVKLPGENNIAVHSEQTELLSFEMGATKTSRANSYEPITIKFPSGIPATIQMLNAFIKKQSMVFSFDAISLAGATGLEALNYTIKLTGAYISSYKQSFLREKGKLNSSNLPEIYDEIKIMFTKIEYTNSNGETAIDNL
jgi:type VI protein secretion system component Hcp